MSSTPKITTTVGPLPTELHPLAADWLHALGAFHWNSSLHGEALSLVGREAVRLTTVQPGLVIAEVVTGTIQAPQLRLAGHDIGNPAELMDACFRSVDRSEPVERQARHWLADIRLRTWLRPTPRELSAATCTCTAPEQDCLHLLALGYAVVAHLDADPRSLLRLRGLDLNLWPASLRPIASNTVDRQPSTSPTASSAHPRHVPPSTDAAEPPSRHDEQADEVDHAPVAEPRSLDAANHPEPPRLTEPASTQAPLPSERLAASAALTAARLLAGHPLRLTPALQPAAPEPAGTRSRQDLRHLAGVDAAAAYSAWAAPRTATTTPAREQAPPAPPGSLPQASAPAALPLPAALDRPAAKPRSATVAVRGAIAWTARCFWEVDYWIFRIDATEALLAGVSFPVPERFAEQARARRHQPLSVITSLGHVTIAWTGDGFTGRIVANDGRLRGIHEGDHLFLLANRSGLEVNVVPDTSKPTDGNDPARFGVAALRLAGHSGPMPQSEADVWTVLATRLGALDTDLLSPEEIRTLLRTRGDSDILETLDRIPRTAQPTAPLPQHSQTARPSIGPSGTGGEATLIALMGKARYRAADKHIRAGRVSGLRTTENWTIGFFTVSRRLQVNVAMSGGKLLGLCSCTMPYPCAHVDAVALHATRSATGIKIRTLPNANQPTTSPQPTTAEADAADARLAALVGRPRARSAKEQSQRWHLTRLAVSANTASAYLSVERVTYDVRIVITRGQLTGRCDCWTFNDLGQACLHMDVLTLHALDRGLKLL
ncbi:hypothetical protein [Streptomyces collinus]|uniref:hypothetical protein n=1 Tax=Streptomyces collinus TaxID=42684 RepID=UPI002943648E|nr:hypothetical protein [Streptomyces collinus]